MRTMSAMSTDNPESKRVVIRVEDDRTGMSPETLERAVIDHLEFTRSKNLQSATLHDVCHALAHTVRDRLVRRWMLTQRTYQDQDVKRVYYLSAEFLLGRFLANNLINLGLYDLAKEGLAERGINIATSCEQQGVDVIENRLGRNHIRADLNHAALGAGKRDLVRL